MKTVQLRRYQLEPSAQDAFVAWWSANMPTMRPAAGFAIEFAYLDRENSQFVWAVSAPGGPDDFRALEDAYMASAERARALESYPEAPVVNTMTVAFVEVVA